MIDGVNYLLNFTGGQEQHCNCWLFLELYVMIDVFFAVIVAAPWRRRKMYLFAKLLGELLFYEKRKSENYVLRMVEVRRSLEENYLVIDVLYKATIMMDFCQQKHRLMHIIWIIGVLINAKLLCVVWWFISSAFLRGRRSKNSKCRDFKWFWKIRILLSFWR